ncbi:hypothetical protein [Phenylobacterium sp.]|uniref:hypothetical protein n=1 Tax=Phenylobacterium sp. TaxID=1871053 RepID=UPI002C1536F5|nr:hypothetical protein [Phenylobacterium sp.]HLZ74886.1 hypothetical protein [Phenylobacterium sp.]
MSSDFAVHSTQVAPPVQAPPPVTPPKPPKSQSDHKPVNEATSSRGPAVVLSGAVAKGADKAGQQAHAEPPPSTGQHVNHVI